MRYRSGKLRRVRPHFNWRYFRGRILEHHDRFDEVKMRVDITGWSQAYWRPVSASNFPTLRRRLMER